MWNQQSTSCTLRWYAKDFSSFYAHSCTEVSLLCFCEQTCRALKNERGANTRRRVYFCGNDTCTTTDRRPSPPACTSCPIWLLPTQDLAVHMCAKSCMRCTALAGVVCQKLVGRALIKLPVASKSSSSSRSLLHPVSQPVR